MSISIEGFENNEVDLFSDTDIEVEKLTQTFNEPAQTFSQSTAVPSSAVTSTPIQLPPASTLSSVPVPSPGTSTSSSPRPARFVPPASPVSTSGISSTNPPSSAKRKRTHTDSDDSFAASLDNIADALRQPVVVSGLNTVPSQPTVNKGYEAAVDNCVGFIGSILKDFKDTGLGMQVMTELKQTCVNACTVYKERQGGK